MLSGFELYPRWVLLNSIRYSVATVVFLFVLCGNRGYYMAARRYEISLRVLKNISLNTRREISYLQAALECSIYYVNTNEILNHFT